jgi:hypothetical protein
MKTPPKATYRIRNWKEYDAALKQRGSITFWVSEAVIEQWNNRGKQESEEPRRRTVTWRLRRWARSKACFIWVGGKLRDFWSPYSG